MSLKNTLVIWAKAARAPFLVVSFLPAVLGGIIAYYNNQFDWLIFTLVTVGIVMAHSAADFIDDYFDFKTGNLGNKEQQFHDSPLIRGEVTLKQVLWATIICMAIALACGVYLLMEVGMPVLYMTLAGAFIVLFYTSPPIKLNYRGLGETALFIAFGPMIVFGTYYVLTQEFSWEPILVSIPIGIFTMNVGIVSNIFDYEDDLKSGKKCMPVRFGQANTHKILVIATLIAYLTLILGVIFEVFPIWTLIGLLTLPIAFGMLKQAGHYTETKFYTPAMTKAIALTSIMGILLSVGYGVTFFV